MRSCRCATLTRPSSAPTTSASPSVVRTKFSASLQPECLTHSVPGQFNSPILHAAIEKTIAACKKHGVVPSIHVNELDAAVCAPLLLVDFACIEELKRMQALAQEGHAAHQCQFGNGCVQTLDPEV